MPRKAGYRHTEETRTKIQADALIKRLHSIAMGKVIADAVQVNAAKSLLNKILPDLKAVDFSGDIEHKLPPMQIAFTAPDLPLPKGDDD